MQTNEMPPRRRAKRGRLILLAASLLCLYVLSYVLLSLTGGWMVSESGKQRLFPAGLATSDILIWQPRYGYCQKFLHFDGSEGLHATELGYFFAPLILLDQRYVHRTIVFIRPDGTMIESFPHYEDYHPLRANRFHGRFPYEE